MDRGLIKVKGEETCSHSRKEAYFAAVGRGNYAEGGQE